MDVTVIAALILHIIIAKVIAVGVAIPVTDTSLYFLDDYDSIAKTHNNNCGCIQFDCGCCQYIEWNIISLNGTFCANVSYWEHDYAISVTMTYNDFIIINETVSARNPPPICFGEDIVDSIEIEVCLHIYDIDIGYGCVATELQKQLEYVDDKVLHLLQLPRKRKTKDSKIPNVVMV